MKNKILFLYREKERGGNIYIYEFRCPIVFFLLWYENRPFIPFFFFWGAGGWGTGFIKEEVGHWCDKCFPPMCGGYESKN